nr:class I tRNA ligase family protein [Gemmatimonadaceae bacterium]
VKTRLTQPGADREIARAVLVHVFDRGLRLLHPIMPFVTEALWQRLPGYAAGTFLAQAAWPVRGGGDAGLEFEIVREAIDAIRGLRSEYGVQPGAPIHAYVAAGAGTDVLAANGTLVQRLARCEIHLDAAPAGAAAHAVLPSGLELSLPLAGMVDVAKERARLQTERDGLVKQLDALRGRLSNEKFTAKAPAAVVEAERAKEREWSTRADQLAAKIAELGG